MTASADAPRVVPLRHYGQWAGAAVVVAVLAFLLSSVFTAPTIQWSVIGSQLFTASIMGGLGVTIWLTVAAMVLGVIGGTLLAVMRLSHNHVLRAIAGGYIWLFRGTPILVQILLWFNLALFFPTIGIGAFSISTNALITPFVAALLALALNEAAYMAEVVRAGILAVDPGQHEAGEALGFSRGKIMAKIVLPQAMKVIIPPTGNEVVTLFKTTSLVAVIGAGDLLTRAQAIGAVGFTRMEMLIVASIWYLVITTARPNGQYLLDQSFRDH